MIPQGGPCPKKGVNQKRLQGTRSKKGSSKKLDEADPGCWLKGPWVGTWRAQSPLTGEVRWCEAREGDKDDGVPCRRTPGPSVCMDIWTGWALLPQKEWS